MRVSTDYAPKDTMTSEQDSLVTVTSHRPFRLIGGAVERTDPAWRWSAARLPLSACRWRTLPSVTVARWPGAKRWRRLLDSGEHGFNRDPATNKRTWRAKASQPTRRSTGRKLTSGEQHVQTLRNSPRALTHKSLTAMRRLE